MKNTKKIISLVLAICMLASLAISASAANTVDASGGTGTSSVTLSSTADGSIGGDPAATKMSVTVPTVLPIAVGTDGTVSTATDAKIVNNSFGAVKVNSVSIEAAQGWSLAAFGDKSTLAHEKVNSNKFGFSLALGNGEKKLTDSKNASKQTLLDSAVEGCFMSGVGDTSANSIGIVYPEWWHRRWRGCRCILRRQSPRPPAQLGWVCPLARGPFGTYPFPCRCQSSCR